MPTPWGNNGVTNYYLSIPNTILLDVNVNELYFVSLLKLSDRVPV